MTAFTERRNHWRLGRHLAGFLVTLIAGAFAPAAAHAASPADPSLKAAYGFEEGSGTVVADNSGTGNTGTVAGPTWTTSGRFGNALTFDGVNDLVSVPDSDSLDLTTAMTLEAWVRPTELTRYRSVIMKEAATALVYALYAETSAAKPKFIVQQAGKLRWVDGPSQLPANTWTHLAATYDGFYFRLFINGTLAAQAGRSGPVTIGSGPLHIGGTLIYPEYFKGEIDEVRIYNRALTNAEVLTDMNTAVAGTADTLPPTTPQNFSATGSSPTSISTSWTASTDDRGVERYELFVNDVPYGTTTLTTHTIDMLSCSSTYQIGLEARDAAGNHSPRTTITASTTACDTTEPAVSLTAPTAGATVSGTLSVTANATDNDAVAGVQFYVDDQPLGAEDTSAPWSAPWNTRSAANGTHTLKARARDRSGNAHTSDSVQVTVENTTAPPADGLVAGWGFDDGSGSTAIDSSGNGNDGAVVGATWRTDGRIGGALEFDGVDDIVNVADADSLDLTSGLTLSAWVRPDILNGAWRTVLFKERSANITYGLYAHDNQLSPGPKPAGEITVGSAVSSVRGPGPLPLSTWSYLAYTYDGLQQRLYVDGVQVASAARTGPIATSTGALRIGGNTIWGERFDGLIDEVRIYNRALPQAEIEADMGTSVSTPDTVKPSAPTNLTAAGSVGRVTLNWTAATDDVGVTRYNIHRSTTPGFTPSAANRVAQPTSTSYADSGLAPNTYYYRVTAEDRAGNVSDASGEANGTAAPDTELPSVSVTEPAGGSTVAGAINVNASAADNDAVANVQFLLDGQALGSPDTSAPYSVSWNTRTAVNGPHTLSARATDASGNQRTADTVSVQVDNTTTPPPGLVASYGFDEGTGSTVSDASGNGNGGSKGGATWVPIGRIGGALSFDGIDDMITVPDSPTLDVTTGVTFSAWVRPDALGSAWRTVLFKQRDGGNLVYGGYANTGLAAVPNGELTIGSTVVPVKGTSKVPDGEWTHLATTYDGAQLNMYVDGALVGTVARTGLIATSSGALHVGGNETWGEYFDGLIDEVRIYDRALPAGEIQTDMITGVTPDSKAPTVTAVTPDADAAGLGVGTSVTATFSEAMDASSITTSTFALRDPSNVVVPATVTYNAATGKATLRPTSALHHNTRYTATLEGGASGSRVKDVAGNALAADNSWSFTTEPTPPPILVVDSAANPFSTYVGEIMRAEGLNGFSINDVSLVDAAYLSNFDVVVLGDVSVTASQVTALTNWVTAGGNLIALSPDKQLAGLLGLTDMGTTLDNGYLRVSTGSAPGAGIVAESIQYHGTADRYALNAGTTAVATLYTNASSPTSSPAVSLRSVGTNGGQAAAFTFDLARSTSLTRQGNPAWAGIERDGFTNSIRTNDLFYGATEPNWVDLNKIGIPQADELQRLFANVITFTNRDRTPVPRFWYLPRGEKAAVIMTGDDHADGGTSGRFDRYKAASPAGCSVENWECARMTSYIYPDSPLTNAQAATYEAEGFEVSVHPFKAGCTNPTYAELDGYYTNRLAQFAAKYTSVPTPTTSRFHCVSWPDWDSHAKIEAAHGIRLDTNYYHFPPDRTTADGTVIPGWGDNPGFMTGSGFPMKFADRQGGVIDVYQAHTHLNDEGFTVPQTQFAIDFLLDHAIGAEGFYGMFTANEHTDKVVSAGSDAILASAQTRAVPVISARQALRWVEGRNGSAFKEFTWSGGRLGFTVTVAPGATGIRGMLPIQSTAGNLTALTRDGAPVTLTARTIKGVAYAFFDASPGRYEARYGA